MSMYVLPCSYSHSHVINLSVALIYNTIFHFKLMVTWKIQCTQSFQNDYLLFFITPIMDPFKINIQTSFYH
jgi:hypothetical protein